MKILISNDHKTTGLKYEYNPNNDDREEYQGIGDALLDLYLCLKHYYVKPQEHNYDYYRSTLLSNESLSKIHDEYGINNGNGNSQEEINEHSRGNIFEYNIGRALIRKDYTLLYGLLRICIDEKMKNLI